MVRHVFDFGSQEYIDAVMLNLHCYRSIVDQNLRLNELTGGIDELENRIAHLEKESPRSVKGQKKRLKIVKSQRL